MQQPFPKRKAPGKYGGQPVRRAFSFAPRDGEKYPSESVAIRSNRLPDDPNRLPSWSWALNYAQVNDCWLVVPITQHADVADTRHEIGTARAGVWRTGMRHGLNMTSEYVAPNLYVKVV